MFLAFRPRCVYIRPAQAKIALKQQVLNFEEAAFPYEMNARTKQQEEGESVVQAEQGQLRQILAKAEGDLSRRDYWVVTDDSVVRVHVNQRTIYVPDPETFPIPIKFIDILRDRRTHV